MNDFISLCHLNQGQVEAILSQRKPFENSHGTVKSGKGWQDSQVGKSLHSEVIPG